MHYYRLYIIMVRIIGLRLAVVKQVIRKGNFFALTMKYL
jgi:hypothetical protein